MYKYLFPDDSERLADSDHDGGRIRLLSSKVPSVPHSRGTGHGDIVPLYNEDGRFTGISTFNFLLFWLILQPTRGGYRVYSKAK
jgi:hypothetical protein